MATVDRHGLPLTVSSQAANHHQVTLVQLNFDSCMMEAGPNHLIGDRAYDPDKLDEEPKRSGIKMIAPQRNNRKKPKTQDGRFSKLFYPMELARLPRSRLERMECPCWSEGPRTKVTSHSCHRPL